MANEKLVRLLLRIGLASVFLYAAVAATLQPQNWIWYFPAFLRNLLPQQILLGGFSLYQLLLSIWLLTGRRIFYAAMLTSLTTLGIIVANLSVIDIVFRDVAIFFAA